MRDVFYEEIDRRPSDDPNDWGEEYDDDYFDPDLLTRAERTPAG